jgi:uncharacterized protein (DUF2237 family)
MIGTTYGHLTVVSYSHKSKSKHFYSCLCECGKESVVNGGHLRSGHTKSCGCMRGGVCNAEKHGQSKRGQTTRLYRTWVAMRQRCFNPLSTKYPYYGARGISVCDRWLSFNNFAADMGTPEIGMSLDRIDNDKNYCTENCRWATTAQQSRNTSRNIYLAYKGKEQTLTDWANELGIPFSTLRWRHVQGWETEKILDHSDRRSSLSA